jgi:hypothetical protein
MLGCGRRRVALLTALAALLVPAGAAQAQLAERPVSDFAGVMVDGPLIAGHADIASEAAVMSGVGIGHARIAMYWREIEPVEGGPLLWGDFDRMVGALAQRGIQVLPVVMRAPGWATGGDEREGAIPDTAAYARFAAQAVRRYGPAGTFWAENPSIHRRPMRDWQIWNEPHHKSSWAIHPDFMASYLTLLRGARAAIKAADPGARIVLGGLTEGPWYELERLYGAGARGAFDVVAIHPYRTTPAQIIRVVRETRRVMTRYGDGALPMFITEMTFTSSKGFVEDLPIFTDEAGQAELLKQLMVRLLAVRHALGIERAYWFTWLSPPPGSHLIWHYAGLRRLAWDRTVVSKPALEALRRVLMTSRVLAANRARARAHIVRVAHAHATSLRRKP